MTALRQSATRQADQPSGATENAVVAARGSDTATFSDWSCLVRLVVGDPTVLAPATAVLRSIMARVDAAASRFRPESDLRWANVNAGRPVAVSATLIRLVSGALQAAEQTGGAVDPTVGRHLDRLGYDRDILLVADSDEPVAAADRLDVTWRDVRVDPAMGLLTVPVGCRLDLGSTAKAQTADWAAQAIHQRFGIDVLVEIGGDLAVAGTSRSWQVAVAERAGGPGTQITLSAGGVATSTTVLRAWRRGDQAVHHIVDPRTGMPADGPWRTVTVAAGDARTANALSTAAIVSGVAAIALLRLHDACARLVGRDGTVVRVGGWPAELPLSTLTSEA